MNQLIEIFNNTGFPLITPGMLFMWLIVIVMLYLAVIKGFEPLLLVPIGFGALLANLPTEGILNVPHGDHPGGLYHYFKQGIDLELFPPLIFMGVGALTDFGPLIANPRTLLLGAAAQFGVFATLIGAALLGYTTQEAAAIGIIGGADGPTSIFIANKTHVFHFCGEQQTHFLHFCFTGQI